MASPRLQRLGLGEALSSGWQPSAWRRLLQVISSSPLLVSLADDLSLQDLIRPRHPSFDGRSHLAALLARSKGVSRPGLHQWLAAWQGPSRSRHHPLLLAHPLTVAGPVVRSCIVPLDRSTPSLFTQASSSPMAATSSFCRSGRSTGMPCESATSGSREVRSSRVASDTLKVTIPDGRRGTCTEDRQCFRMRATSDRGQRMTERRGASVAT